MNFGYKKNNESSLHGVYTIKNLFNVNKIIIKPIGTIKLNLGEFIADKLVKTYNITKNIPAEIYQCNILDKYIMTNKKLPIIYISVIYENISRKICLLKLYLYFTIESIVKNSKELIDNELSGKYSIEIVIGDKHEILDDNLSKINGIETLTNFLNTNNMIELIEDLKKNEIIKLKEKFEEEYGHYNIPKKTISLRNYKFE